MTELAEEADRSQERSPRDPCDGRAHGGPRSREVRTGRRRRSRLSANRSARPGRGPSGRGARRSRAGYRPRSRRTAARAPRGARAHGVDPRRKAIPGRRSRRRRTSRSVRRHGQPGGPARAGRPGSARDRCSARVAGDPRRGGMPVVPAASARARSRPRELSFPQPEDLLARAFRLAGRPARPEARWAPVLRPAAVSSGNYARGGPVGQPPDASHRRGRAGRQSPNDPPKHAILRAGGGRIAEFATPLVRVDASCRR
jgi:hypothetical protein